MTRREQGIVAAALATQAAAVGSTFGSFSLFVLPVSESFGASRGAVASGAALISLMLGLSGLFVGGRFDRGSPRRVMLTGALLQPLCLLLASRAPGLPALALLCMAAGALMPTVGPLASASVVGKAFRENRGRALGLVNTGVAVGGMSFSLLASVILVSWGWRDTLACFGLVSAAVMIPAVLWGIPEPLAAAAPSAPGAAPGSAQSGSPAGRAAQGGSDWTPALLLRMPEFYACAISLGVGVGLASGWGAHTAAFFQDRGAATATAARVVAVTQGLAIPGALLLGRLADRFGARNLLASQLALLAVGFALYRSDPPLPVVFAIAAFMGLCSGGIVPVYTQLVVQRFGVLSLGRVMGLSNLFLLPAGVGMPPFVGVLHDRFGSYAQAHQLFIGLLVFPVLALLLFVKQRPAQSQPGPGER